MTTKKWTPARLLTEACNWADALCEDAYWHDGRCSWLGHSPDEAPQTGPIFSGVSGLGPELYAGTSGVALFLAHLANIRLEHRYVETSSGAIRHALHRVHEIPSDVMLGLHAGAMGVAFAAIAVGRLLQRDDLVTEGVALSKHIVNEAGDRPLLDFVSGSASAICGLLVISDWTNDRELLDLADRLGQGILDRAAERGTIWSWANADMNGSAEWSRPLNGLAHGQAGLAVSLLELYARTNTRSYREAAFGAFAYEDQFIDDEHGNWRDMRVEDGADANDTRHTTAWCHGAPGIALTRLRGMELVPECREALARTVTIALRGTRAYADKQLQAKAFDVTNCHGLGGLTEPYVMAAHAFGNEQYLEDARALWADAIRRRGEQATWLSGVGSGGKNPSLMVGSAGVGYALLRAYEPSRVPSVLLPSAV
jgi:lantibiotic biosynthesis protein